MSHHQPAAARTIRRLVSTINALVKIIRAKDSENAGLRAIISTLKQENDQLHVDLENDPLTGVYNRTGLRSAWRRLSPAVTAVMIIDGDGFKQINDRHGHAFGDDIICLIADTLSACNIVAARFGGDEFIGLIVDSDPTTVAETFRQKLAQPRIIRGEPITVTATIGLCYVVRNDDDDTPMCDYLDRADAALYAGKHAGRNTIRITS
jgi:diguanylate cyclase (GGDEF)-like protein